MNAIRRTKKYLLLKIDNYNHVVRDRESGKLSPIFSKDTELYKLIRYYEKSSAKEVNAICDVMFMTNETDLQTIKQLL